MSSVLHKIGKSMGLIEQPTAAELFNKMEKTVEAMAKRTAKTLQTNLSHKGTSKKWEDYVKKSPTSSLGRST
jgi:hypothetical protein